MPAAAPAPCSTPKAPEHRDVRGEGAQHRCDDVHPGADQQRSLAAERVRQRADHELADGKAEQGAGEGELDAGFGGEQVSGDRRQGRQVHVDGQRAERDQRTQHHHQADPGGSARRGDRLPGGAVRPYDCRRLLVHW